MTAKHSVALHGGTCTQEYCYKGMAETMHPVSKSRYFLGKFMMWCDMILIIPNHFFLVSKSQNSSTPGLVLSMSHNKNGSRKEKRRREEDSKGGKKINRKVLMFSSKACL
jgi:hypothetical protein